MIFHSYVSLPEGNLACDGPMLIPVWSQKTQKTQKTHIVHQCSGLNFNDTARLRSPFGCVKSRYVHHVIIISSSSFKMITVNSSQFVWVFIPFHPWRIHAAAIYGVPWIPSIYPSQVSIYIPAPWILWVMVLMICIVGPAPPTHPLGPQRQLCAGDCTVDRGAAIAAAGAWWCHL